ncbi:hypothetical protein EUGRSUZ_B01184 [Eucalyptus grandis]|uniref:Uncharacterized protein n=2 Tax=Eucalyptus grandis TaxID=71139 RepID=A0A059D1I3_EUCGR|nr:hypothetical protein EUGRSUZ_B01184 [Eucalyptus grandis]
MAEAIIVGIAGEIITNLVPQALEKIGKLWGIKHDLEMLRDIVSTVQAVLDDAEEQYYQSHEIQVWLNKMKDALYDAQDVLEEFNIEAMGRELKGHNEMMKEVRTFFSTSNQLAFKLKMSYKIRAVRERIEAINAGRRFHLNERPVDLQVEREQRKRGETHSFIREENIRGRDGDKKTIMEFLLDSNMNENVSILPIVGIGGLGKTTLAQFVFNDEAVSEQFNLKMWVCVSNDFDMKKIVKMMLASAKQNEPTEDTMELLQNKLRVEIDGKKYLLVLDDLWNTEREKWLNLKNLLDEGAKGSKILITTRLPLVAKITGTIQAYSLRGLSDGMSFDLLMQMACCKEEELQDPNMRVIGEDIVRKCSGVPLVIRTVGSLLFFKQTKSEWLHFKDYELPEVSQREDCIKSVLKLSYDHLPSHLKQCFAYCSLFPKDYVLKKQTLGRSLGSQKDLFGHQIEMHDLMHDLACSVAGTKCWVAWDDTKLIHERTRHISYNSTSNLMGKTLISCLKASALQTFLSATRRWGRNPQPTSQADLRRLIQSFKRLRILDLHSASIKKVPRFICKLKHLTYLDLSYNNALKSLPNSITRLHNLQTLNLRRCESLEELPRDIRKLVSLRNLDINGCDKLSYMPCGLGQLSSLHALSNFILPKDKALVKKYCGLRELSKLNNIRGSLSIENLGSVTDAVEESQAANLRGKCSLKSLILSWKDIYDITNEEMITKRGIFDITDEAMIMKRDEALLDGLRPPDNLQELIIKGYNGESFPRWMTELPNLVELRLKGCKRCRWFPQLGLSKLKLLKINGMNSLEYLPGECLASLTSLESLFIWHLPRLTSLPLGLRHLSKLDYLSIWHCKELDISKDESGNILDFHGGLQSLRSLNITGNPKLESLPQWILQLRSLESLDISECEELDLSKDESGNIILDFHGGLQSLRFVELKEIPKLESLPQWILLRSLETLKILNCPNFKELSEQIEKCEELDISIDESSNILDFHGGLLSLRFVDITGLPKLTSLPQWLLQARNLERLEIWYCNNLKDIPEQIEALQSLQNLVIMECSSLTSFPEAMRRLKSLTHLHIYECGELEESCKRQAGKDWDKIAHIPHIRFDW